MKRTFFYIIAAMLLIVVTIGCKKDKDVTHVTLDKKEITINVGESAILEATVHPGDATNKAVSWKSSDEAVAKVVNGTISAQQGGRATITVTTEDGGYTATCEVIVIPLMGAVIGVYLDKTNLNLSVGGTATLTATVVPLDAFNKTVSWTSSNPAIVTVTGDGVVFAQGLGTATITVTTEDGGYTATCTAVVAPTDQEWVMINGIKWATRNVDAPGTFAANPEDAGMFYQWNRKLGWSATEPIINSDGGTTWDSSNAVGETWDKANDPCPSGWRVPTEAEFQRLIDAGFQMTTMNDINGYMFGSGDNTLFLCAAGWRIPQTGQLYIPGVEGCYWSDNGELHEQLASHLQLIITYSGGIPRLTYNLRSNGYSVRCVAE